MSGKRHIASSAAPNNNSHDRDERMTFVLHCEQIGAENDEKQAMRRVADVLLETDEKTTNPRRPWRADPTPDEILSDYPWRRRVQLMSGGVILHNERIGKTRHCNPRANSPKGVEVTV